MKAMPSLLAHTSARVLEFESLRHLLRGYSSSPLGQQRIAGLSPSLDRNWIEDQHQLTSEVREFRRVGGHFEFSGLLDVSPLVEKSRIAGAALETPEIRDVTLVVDRAAEWRGTRWPGFPAASPISPTFSAPFATRSCRTARWTTAPHPSWPASVAKSSGRES